MQKLNKLTAIVAFTLFVSSLATAALPPWTNSFFLTDDNTIYSHRGDETFIKPEKIEEARLSKESRPAENDPEGNWGSVSEGFRLSLRFSKDTFTVGEPIIATVILRNVTPETLRCFKAHPISVFELFVIDGLKNRIPYQSNLREQYSRGSVSIMDMYAGMQWKYQLRVDELFNMTSPGAYLIYTKRWVQKLESIGSTEVVSGNATIHIVNAPKAAGQANPGNTGTTTSSSPTALANPGAAFAVGGSSPANTRPSARAAEPKSVANPPKNILQPTPKTPIAKIPAQLAQAETGGGLSSRDKVYGLLVLGLVLGLGGLLFRARASRPRS